MVKACANIDSELIVIDNNSTDGSKSFFEGKFPGVQFLWHPENLGFGKANNLALKSAAGKYVLFLNPDTILPEDSIKKSLDFFRSTDTVGGLGVRMIDGSGRFLKESKRAFPSPATAFFKLSGLTALFPRSKIFACYYLGHLDERSNHIVDVLAGAYMMIPKSVLKQVGSFDEAFFMYGEDVDLSYRIQKSGYHNYYFAETTIIHFKGESTKKETTRYIRLFYGAMELFVRKHFNTLKAGLFSMLIRGAILFKIAMAGLKKMTSSSSMKKRTLQPDQQKFLLVADIVDHQTIINQIHLASIKDLITLNLDLNSFQQHLKFLAESIDQYKPNGIIFCAGNSLSYQQIIYLTENIKQEIPIYFYTPGTSAIVGSSDKDSIGDFIPVSDNLK